MDVLYFIGVILVIGIICVAMYFLAFVLWMWLPLAIAVIVALLLFMSDHDNMGVVAIIVGGLLQYAWLAPNGAFYWKGSVEDFFKQQFRSRD